jgi:hypothetical protein
VSGSLRAGVTFPSSSPLEGNPSTHWAFRPVCVHPKRESSATQRTDRTRAGHPRRAFPVLPQGVSHHAMRVNNSARRQVVRQQGRPVAKTREASPRYATSCRDLVRTNRKVRAHENEERLQSSETRGLSKGLEPPERRCPRPRRPLTFTSPGARVGLGRLRTRALEIARGPLEADDRHQRRYATRTVGKTTPRDASIAIDRSTHGDVNRRPTWFEHRKKALVLQEPHDTRLPVLREMGTRWSYASHRRLSWMRHSR